MLTLCLVFSITYVYTYNYTNVMGRSPFKAHVFEAIFVLIIKWTMHCNEAIQEAIQVVQTPGKQ